MKTETFTEAQAANGIFYRYYAKESAGIPLIMVMGYGACMFTWPFQFLHRLAEDFPIILFDNRGTGRSKPFDQVIDLRIHNLAEDLKGLLDHLELEKVNLFGYSMGGCVSLEFAKMFPERLDKLLLQSTTAGGALYTGADQEVKDRMANPRGTTFDEMFFDFFDLCMPQDALQTYRPVLDGICANARSYPTPIKVLGMQVNAFRHFDASPYVQSIKNKALVFHGENDRILKIQNGEQLAGSLPDSQSVFLADCGHCPHIEYEDTIVFRSREFLQSEN